MHGIHGFRSFRNLVLAIFLIIGMGAIFISAMYALKLFPSQRTIKTKTIQADKLPDDVPVYNGAVLIDFKRQDDKSIYQYKLPLGSITTARAFYETEMAKKEWAVYVSSENAIGFYKSNGERQVFINLEYVNTKVKVTLELLNKS
jgi:hypothetical protein